MRTRTGRTLLCGSVLAVMSVCWGSVLRAATVSALFARGYTVIPAPQQVTLSGKDFEVATPWRLDLGPGVKADDVAVQSLQEGLRERFHFAFSEGKGKGGGLKLAIDPQAVGVGEATDRQKAALAEQASDLHSGVPCQ